MTDTDDTEIDEAAIWKEATSGMNGGAPEEARTPVEQAAEEAAGEDAGETQQKEAAESPQDEAASEPLNTAPETNPEKDIWADAPDELKTAYQAVKNERDGLNHRLKSEEGRQARFQRERDEALRQLGAVAKVAGHEDLEAYLASDEYKKVKAEYGGDLDPVFKTLETLAARDKQTEQRLSEIAEAGSRSSHDANVDWLNQQAPGWVDTLDREDFGPWFEAQPQGVRDMLDRNRNGLVDPAEVKVVHDLFKAHVGQTASPQQEDQPAPQPKNDRRRERQLDGARSASSRAPILTEPDMDDDSDATWREATKAAEKLVGTYR